MPKLRDTRTRETATKGTSIVGRGAPEGNSNSVRHGLRAGNLPKGLRWVEHRVNGFRRIVEEAVIELKGRISLTDAAAINTAIRWERHAILAGAWLRKACDTMNHDQRLKYSEAVAKASDARDRHIRSLGLDVESEVPSLASYIVDGMIPKEKN